MGQDVYGEDTWKGHKQKDSDSQYGNKNQGPFFQPHLK